ncbi:hypothetical protein ARMGADRAFT_818976 [Armillaria gallica]|uniref:Uncharacterized protein n=1 Tax=Armillaria gallica TaxID=47427 RepID=A0A2H3CCX6_ARMGA|nr:hypothetical protein ARMGADRAFT_818976 [Armillaria gallica]
MLFFNELSLRPTSVQPLKYILMPMAHCKMNSRKPRSGDCVTGTPASLNSSKHIVNDRSVKTITTGRALNSDTTSPPKLHQDHTTWTYICVYLGLRTHKLQVWATMRVVGVFLPLARIAQAPIPRGIITRGRRTTIISFGNHSILVASSSCLAR